MRVAEINVRRSEHHSVRRLVGSWEIPILQFEHSPEKVEVLGFKRLDERAYPDPQQEFERLSLRYGIDTDNGATKAALVYGQGQMGVLSLRNLIEQERKLEAEGGLETVNLTHNVVPLPDAPTPVAPVQAPTPAAEVIASRPTLGLPKAATA